MKTVKTRTVEYISVNSWRFLLFYIGIIIIIVILCAVVPAISGMDVPEESSCESSLEVVTTTDETSTETGTTLTETTTTTTDAVTSKPDDTTTASTTTSTTASTTKRLMSYDVKIRIDIITMLLDQSDYKRLIEKSPDKLTDDERVELQYYSCLVFERKQLREYLESQAGGET